MGVALVLLSVFMYGKVLSLPSLHDMQTAVHRFRKARGAVEGAPAWLAHRMLRRRYPLAHPRPSLPCPRHTTPPCRSGC